MICEWYIRPKHSAQCSDSFPTSLEFSLVSHTHLTSQFFSLWQGVAPLWPSSFICAWSLSSTLHNSQWGSASNRLDPWRAPRCLVPLSPSSSSFLTCLIPHSLPVKGPKPWLLVAHVKIPFWKMGWRTRERGRQTEAKSVIAMAANHRQTLRVEWINALSTWDSVHSLSQPSTHA